MAHDVTMTIGAGGDFATLADFAVALPTDLVAADQRWIAEFWNGPADPGGAVINTVSDATRYVVLRAAPGQGPGDLMDPITDPLRATAGSGAMIGSAVGDAVRAEGASTRLAVVNLQITAAAGAALSDDGAAQIFSVTNTVLEANSAIAAASIRGTGGITGSTILQRGPGDGVALVDGALAEGCTIVKTPKIVADGTGVSFGGVPASGARGCFVTGFGRAYGTGSGTAEALVSDQINVLAVADDFSDPYWTAVSSTVDPGDTVPGPYAVPLQWLGNNLNSFARFDGPVVASVPGGERFSFSMIVAQPTTLISAILLDSVHGRPELRITWSQNPPLIEMLAQTANFAARVGTLTDLGGGEWRLFLEAENTTAAALDVTPTVYVTRGVENSGLDVGMYAGAMMAGAGHLGVGFVEVGAVPGPNAVEGVDPIDAVGAVASGFEDLRPAVAGPLDGSGAALSGGDLYLRHRNSPDTAGAVTLNPAWVAVPVDGVLTSGVDAVRLIDQTDLLSAQARRTVLAGNPVRRIGV